MKKAGLSEVTFAQMLANERLSEELTMAQFAKKLEISVSHLNDIEKGRKFVSPQRAALFATKLGYSETKYVRIALQDILNHSGLNKFRVDLEGSP